MSLARDIAGLLTRLTDNQIDALGPDDRRLLRDQLERVHRALTGATIARGVHKGEAPAGAAPLRGKAAFLDELRDGQGRE